MLLISLSVAPEGHVTAIVHMHTSGEHVQHGPDFHMSEIQLHRPMNQLCATLQLCSSLTIESMHFKVRLCSCLKIAVAKFRDR